MSEPEHDYFREYHRVGTRIRATRIAATVAIVASLIAGVTALAAQAPPSPQVASESVAEPVPSASATAAAVAEVLPSPDVTVAASPTPTPTPTVDPQGARSWTIAIDTTGYQAEIDQCLWVRMDLGVAAPIVGAHNYCGGSVVLDMAIGDTVVLSGTGLDGTYRVAEERLANAGDNAAEATEGLSAAVILQTCFWVNDGSERLIALLPA